MGVAVRGFSLWAHSATKLWTVLVPLFGATLLIGVLMIDSAAPAGSVAVDGKIVVFGGSTGGLVRVAVLRFILLGLVGVLSTGVGLRVFAEASAGRSETASDAVRFALGRYGSLLWVSILYTVFLLAGGAALILPGIYLLVAFAVALPAFACEGERGGAALRRSRDLVRGRWWATLGTLLPSTLLVVLGGVIVETALNVSGTVASLALTQGVAQLVVAVLLTPILTATTIAIYDDLHARSEAAAGTILDLSEPLEGQAGAAVSAAPAAQGEAWWG
jgi:hypothetical protein